MGRQYIGEIGKTDNGIVLLTTHLYDGVRRLPLDLALYQHASSLEQGSYDPEFVKKPDLALQLIDQCLARGYRPGVTLVDAAYGNNTPFIKQLESRKLVYVAAVAKNRQVSYQLPEDEKPRKRGLAEIAKSVEYHSLHSRLAQPGQTPHCLVAVMQVQVPKLEGPRWIAIQLNASTYLAATDIDYFLTNAPN